MTQRWGLPYKGSKRAIAQSIVGILPSADTLVDLFAGGCAVTHAALSSGKWRSIIANDICESVPRLFVAAASGMYHDETRWISRDDFFRLYRSDPYVRICWSFGNEGNSYLYSRAIEPYKEAMHYAVVFRDFRLVRERLPEVADALVRRLAPLEDRRARLLASRKAVRDALAASDASLERLERLKQLEQLQHLEHLERLERLQSLERLERLQSLERFERLQSLERFDLSRLSLSARDYREVEIPPGAVVYADPPYAGTSGYGMLFDSAAFFDWVRRCPNVVFFSSYSAPADFALVSEWTHLSRIAATRPKRCVERLYCNRDGGARRARLGGGGEVRT